METDLEFAQRCARGERQAWDEFLVKYSRLIYTYVFSAARSSGVLLTLPEKEDLFQEILISLIDDNFRKLKSFRALNNCSLASWLRQVTINYTLNRVEKKMPPLSYDEETVPGRARSEQIMASGTTPNRIVEENENILRLSECIETLALDDKYFLELNLSQGLNLEEIREHLRITRGAADMRKQRIVARLRECFKMKGLPDG